MDYLIEAITLGFLYGVGPCTLFCAPILVPLVISTSSSGREGIMQIFTYGFGRILSYASLGIISGYLGYLFGGFVSMKLIGIFIAGLGVLLLLKRYEKKCPKFLGRIKGKHFFFISGVIFGFRPCPALLAILSLAVLTRSVFRGGLIGIAFGLGTILSPLIILGFLAGRWSERSEELREINFKLCALFLIFLGLWIWLM
jgi:hypothetical protein